MNTVLLRLEGPLQSWGDHSRHEVRDTSAYPTKSGVLGLVCAAMGLSRQEASSRLSALASLAMGVRIDRAGSIMVEYQTVGAKEGNFSADGTIKGSPGDYETGILYKHFLEDASFLVALHGDTRIVAEVAAALRSPKWPLYLGRKRCPPSVPVLGDNFHEDGCTPSTGLKSFPSPKEALADQPLRVRKRDDIRGETVVRPVILEGVTGSPVWDVPLSFGPPTYGVRRLIEDVVIVRVESDPLDCDSTSLARDATRLPGWNTNNTPVGEEPRRERRLEVDQHSCVCCADRAHHVHHVTYRHKGHEPIEDLRSLCSPCHDACTLIEYSEGMTLDRVDPLDPRRRVEILALRQEMQAHKTGRRY